MVTEVPTDPEAGFRLVMLGGGVSVKATPLLAAPFTVTTTFPVVAPFGTTTEALELVQPKIVAGVPLNVTVLEPSDGPKLVPVMNTEEPTGPEVGLKEVMLGGGVVTVKLIPLLSAPLALTATFPVDAPVGTGTTILVALQMVGVAGVPLNMT